MESWRQERQGYEEPSCSREQGRWRERQGRQPRAEGWPSVTCSRSVEYGSLRSLWRLRRSCWVEVNDVRLVSEVFLAVENR